MSGNTDHLVAPPDADGWHGAAASRKGRWWQHLAFVLFLAALARVSLYFLALVAAVIFFSDQRRNRYTRLGGTILIAWWTLTWSWSAAPPLVAFGLLAASAAAYVAAARIESGRWRVVRSVALATAAGALGVLNLVPWGLRDATIDRNEAVRLALAARHGTVIATDVQIAPTRKRLTQRPVYAVLLFERNGTKLTADGEPCFRRLDAHLVDGLDGAVDRREAIEWLTLDPLLDTTTDEVAEAREKDGFCLPVPRGISSQVRPVDTAP